MGNLSNKTTGSRDAEIEELTIKLNSLQSSFVGMMSFSPPTALDGSIDPAWVPAGGQILSRAAYPALWERIKLMGNYVSDAEWLAIQAASPNGAVSVYSSGDGSTTFRMITVGEDGGFIRATGTDPVLNALRDLQGGFQDQIQNITGSFRFTASSNTWSPFAKSTIFGAFEGVNDMGSDFQDPSSSAAGSSTRDVNVIKLDASRVARTGEETHPKGMFGTLYVYSGNATTVLPEVTPDWLIQQDANTQEIAKIEQRDFVIEEVVNNDDGWWYRKWNNGYAEQGGRDWTNGSAWSKDQYGASIRPLPLDILASKPYSIESSGTNCTSSYFWDGGALDVDGKALIRGKFYARGTDSSAPSGHADVVRWYATGYWK